MSLSPSPKNPFVYGRVLTAADAACRRPELEERVKQAAWDDGRIALVGDRRMGKSSLVQRTLETLEVPMLRLNYHEVLDLPDVVMRTLADIERFLRARSPIARRLVPWLREAGIEIRELRAANADLRSGEIRHQHPALFAAACKARFFGSWTKALQAAEVPVSSIA